MFGKQIIDPTEHAILFMDHPGLAQHPGRCQRGDRRIPAKADNHIGLVAQHTKDTAKHTAQNTKRCDGLGHQTAAREGGAADLLNLDRLGETAGIARTPRVGGQLYPPAPRQHDLGKRLGGKHMPARPPCGDDQQRRRHRARLRPNRSEIWPCGRVRVNASNMPTAMPEAITDDPP